jgi:hypothetical protein
MAGARAPLVLAVVETVRVLVPAAAPLMLIAVGFSEHAGISVTLMMAVLTEHVTLTLPVKPFAGVTLFITVKVGLGELTTLTCIVFTMWTPSVVLSVPSMVSARSSFRINSPPICSDHQLAT